ncbi:hypothetical protein [uncultured Erythrobacter sp.]|uniref:hypothetical protein n=1 Tax=uncultured Erythrobacter sp. TaxID=263913 RepID=UPI0026340FE2|nr:hypothetical protein [uncultured Erythrobacter sp.]
MLELLASEYRIVAQDILAVTLCLAALVLGGGPERAVALTWLVVFQLGDWAYDSVVEAGPALADIYPFPITIDVCAGLMLTGIALYANRNYTLFIAGMQVLAVTVHFVRSMFEAVSPVTFNAMVLAPGWLLLIFLGIGLTRHILRKRKYGAYRDWRIPPQWTDRIAANPLRARLAAVFEYDLFAKKDER